MQFEMPGQGGGPFQGSKSTPKPQNLTCQHDTFGTFCTPTEIDIQGGVFSGYRVIFRSKIDPF